jgi:GalNAc5-diNAcBac-PP-undecaprenol beta-1,3-glucosyltransferase
MTIDATILLPTFDHGAMIRFPLESALAQTARDIEILVVGDGAPEVTREVVGELAESDPRIRFFDNPKGPRHGEVHRHAALAEARGRIVLYLSDDDLWFPDHVTTMLGVLDEADVATAASMRILPGKEPKLDFVDIARPEVRAELLSADRPIRLSSGGHTLAAYRRLPHGWRTTPDGITIGKYFWPQFFADANTVCRSARHVTVLHFGSSQRHAMTTAQRCTELATWWRRIRDEPALDGELTLASLTDALAHLERARHKQLRRRLGGGAST